MKKPPLDLFQKMRQHTQPKKTDAFALQQSIQLHLQQLLCSVQLPIANHTPPSNLQPSTISYGIPDFTRVSEGRLTAIHTLCQSIQTAILMHEKRLNRVAVYPLASTESEGELTIVIEALLEGAIATSDPLAIYFSPTRKTISTEEPR